MFYVCDTEDNGEGKVLKIFFYNGKEYYKFYTQNEAIAFLDSIESNIVIWCCNMQYDVINIFGERYLVENCKLTFSKSSLLGCIYKKCKFRDTVAHWKISVYRMGEIIGIPKLSFAPNDDEYCERDCLITWTYTNYMLKEYAKLEIDARLTIASTALSYWITRFNAISLKKIPVEYLEYFRNFYFGGRTECFKIGDIKGNIHCIDINSLYPYCMAKYLPNPFRYEEVKEIPYGSFYLIECIVESNLNFPILPYRLNNHLCFPNGRFKGYFTSIEFEKFLELGGKLISIERIIHFPVNVKPFETYVNLLYDRRLKSKNEYEKDTFKLLLNSLYGKFGQGNEITAIVSMKEFLDNKDKYKINGAKPCLNNEYVITTEFVNYPKHTNFIWSLFITSYGRLTLYNLVNDVREKGNEILYCDTDSVFYIGEKLQGGKELGNFKHEFETSRIFIRNVKEYYYQNDDNDYIFKVKGIPKDNIELLKEYFKGEEVEFKRPVKLRESLRSVKNKGKANIWTKYTKCSKGTYEKGIVLADGKIKPFEIDEIIFSN